MRPVLALSVLLLLLASSVEARRFERAGPVVGGPSVVEESFGAAPAFRLELAAIPGELHRMRGAKPRLLDFADYSAAGVLTVHRSLVLGPLATGPALVPPGEYRVSLNVAGPEGLPVLGLASPDGLRLRIPMIGAPRPSSPPRTLSVVSLASDQPPTVSLPLAVHLPTASGLLVIGPAGIADEAAPQRRRTRGAILEEELQRRALESGHVRSLQRKKAR